MDNIDFFEAIESDEFDYEDDLSDLQYMKWVDNYPQNISVIFGDLMHYAKGHVKENDIKYFIDKGININDSTCNCDGYSVPPLMSACEYRDVDLITSLCKYGANVNFADKNGVTILETLLCGHDADSICPEFASIVWSGLKILVHHGVAFKIKKWVADECYENYFVSPAILQFLDRCELINTSYD